MNSILESVIGTLERDDESAELRIQAALELAYSAETSLSKLIMEKQAEALENLKNVANIEYGTTGVAVDIISVLEIADKLRRQAEGVKRM